VSGSSAWATATRRVLRNRLSVVGVFVLATLLVMIVVGPFVWTVSPTDQDLTGRLSGMSAQHPFGTDALGRDVLSRVMNGGRVSIALAVLAAVASAIVGGVIGVISGFVRGSVDSVLMRVMEVILSFPALILALAISAAAPGMFATFVAVAIPAIPLYARLVRSMVLSVRARDYVLAARAIGVPTPTLIRRHVVPNSISPLIIQTTIGIGLGLQYIAALGYLGLGVQPPTPEWGAILSDSQTFLLQAPLVLVAPGLIIALAIVSFNLLGDALRDLLDPGGGR
jgi:peptide/nickel transport system permease protein